MDLRSWIVAEHAAVRDRISQQVLARVPTERRDECPDGSSSIAWLLWHLTRHQDVAVHAVVRGGDDVLQRDGWAARVGATGFVPGTGLSEGDDRAAAAALDLDALDAYVDAVWAETAGWLTSVDPAELDRVPDAAAGLARLAVSDRDYDWLYRMWDGKPVSFHVSWETIGHGFNHLGEMVHLRNAMGLGGF
jgi:DinB superfamily